MLNKIDQILSVPAIKCAGWLVSFALGTALTLVALEKPQVYLGVSFFVGFVVLIVAVACWLKQPQKETKMFFYKNTSSVLLELLPPNPTSNLSLEKVVAHEDVKCAVLSDEQKKENKCIIQISFILVDGEGKIAVIRRKSHSLHTKDSLMVSFSPFPNRFGETLSLEEIFEREIPKTKFSPKFLHFANVTDKNKNYLFFVHKAIYEEIPNLNDPALQAEVFNEKSKNKKTAFIKDKDKILGFYPLKEIIDKEESGQFVFIFADKNVITFLANNGVLPNK